MIYDSLYMILYTSYIIIIYDVSYMMYHTLDIMILYMKQCNFLGQSDVEPLSRCGCSASCFSAAERLQPVLRATSRPGKCSSQAGD